MYRYVYIYIYIINKYMYLSLSLYIYIYIYPPISLLRLSLLSFVGSTIMGNSLGAWEFHPLISRFCLSKTPWNPEA